MNLPHILAHLIGDFLFQNDWMAVEKKKSNLACTIHVFFYMIPFLLTEISIIQFLLIASQHWVQDRTSFIAWWCKRIGSFQGEIKHHALVSNNKFERVLPWGHFIKDQIFHSIWIWMVINCM
jgi:hypothetical protein